MDIEERLFTLFFSCSSDVFYEEIIYSSKFILSAFLPILICIINYFFGLKYYRWLQFKDLTYFSRNIGIFFFIRIGLLLLVSFFLVKFSLIYIGFFFISFFFYFFLFKIVEVVNLNKFGR